VRQNKYLIQEARENTNTVDNESITDYLCTRLMTRSQDFIMAHLYSKNIKTKIFRSTQEITVANSVDTYDLAFDIYAVNSISSVQQVISSGSSSTYAPINQISEKDRGIKAGYFVVKGKVIFSGFSNSSMNVLISYAKKNASLGVSYGSVASVTPTTITLNVGYGVLTGITDFFTVVDSNGEVLVRNLPVSQALGVLTVPSTTGVLVGSIIVPGAYATTHCQLPDELESTLIYMLEKLINARLSSTDMPISTALSTQQLEQISEMFSDNSGDSFMPPILEYTEWA